MRFARRSRVAAAMTLAVALVALGGCTSKGDSSSTNGKTPDKVTYLTSFGQFGRDAYIWLAVDRGYFKDAGIDITVETGKGNNNAKVIAANTAQFAALDLSGALISITTATSPLDIQAVAALQQNAMAAVFTLEGSGITKPSDLAGKRIADIPGSMVKLLFPTYAKLANFDPATVKWTNGTAQNLPQLLGSGSVDAIDQFVVGVPTVEKITGKKVFVLPYSDYMSDLYGNALFTNKKMIHDNPDLVRRFQQALLHGLKDAVQDPQAAAKALANHVKGTNEQAAAAEVILMKSYTLAVPNGGAFGSFDKNRVARGIAVLQGAGAIPHSIAPDEVVDFDLTPKA